MQSKAFYSLGFILCPGEMRSIIFEGDHIPIGGIP